MSDISHPTGIGLSKDAILAAMRGAGYELTPTDTSPDVAPAGPAYSPHAVEFTGSPADPLSVQALAVLHDGLNEEAGRFLGIFAALWNKDLADWIMAKLLLPEPKNAAFVRDAGARRAVVTINWRETKYISVEVSAPWFEVSRYYARRKE